MNNYLEHIKINTYARIEKICHIQKIYNKDFENGPFIISKPGCYVLQENIELNFLKYENSIWNHNNANIFGIPAGIIIESSDVILDLNNYTIKQNIRDYILQRFFAIIQLNDKPFINNKGPIPGNLQKIKTPCNIIIKNGLLGLSSHQAILGNGNCNIFLENLRIFDFEVTGITLNNIKNLIIDNVHIGQSNKIIPVSPLFSGLIFLFKLLNTILLKENYESEVNNKINGSMKDIQLLLKPCINILYSFNLNLFEYYEKIKICSIKSFLINKIVNGELLSPCNIQGIKITGMGPSINEFHTSILSDNEISDNILIKNVTIQHLNARVDEDILFGKSDGKPYHIGAGIKLSYTILNSDIFRKIINDIYCVSSKYIKIKEFININLDSHIIEFINTYEKSNTIIPNKNVFIIRNCDIMGHLNKGTVGLRIGSTKNVSIKNIIIEKIYNKGELKTEKINEINKNNILSVYIPDSTLVSNSNITGPLSIGIILSSVENADIVGIKINKIVSQYNSAIGLCINNLSKCINISKLIMNNIESNDNSEDTYSYLIDNKSKKITLSTEFN